MGWQDLSWKSPRRQAEQRANEIKAQIARDGIFMMRQQLAHMVGSAMLEMKGNKSFMYAAEQMAKAGPPPGPMKNVHEEVGRKALVSGAQAYTHRRHKRKIASYRVGDPFRNAGGKMNRALRSKQNVKATSRTLSLYDKKYMDTQAAQWWRLNFGAGAAGSNNQAKSYPVRLAGGGTLLTLAITGNTSRPFVLPPGVFFGEGGRVAHSKGAEGSDPFYFRGGSPPPGGFGKGRIPNRRPTRGIVANNFLDAAAKRVASEIGPGYDRVMRDMVKNVRGGGAQKVHAHAPARYTNVFKPR